MSNKTETIHNLLKAKKDILDEIDAAEERGNEEEVISLENDLEMIEYRLHVYGRED